MTPAELRALRAVGPVHHLDTLGCSAFVRHADVVAALTDSALYSSAGGNGQRAEAGSTLLVALDPPDHAEVRRPVARAFTAARVDALAGVAAATAASAVGRGVRRGHLDVVADLAEPVAVATLAALLGLRPERLAALRQGHSFPREPLPLRWRRFFESHIADGPSAFLADLLADGLGERQVVDVCLLLLVAGWDTPRDFVACAVYELAHRRLPFEPVSGLVDELARYVSPVQAVFRLATADTGPVPAGTRVLLSLASANHDEAVWDAPDDLVVGRTVAHVGFGAGAHACLGARLARAQLATVLRTLDEVSVRPAGAPRWAPVPWFRRLRAGPLTISRRAGC